MNQDESSSSSDPACTFGHIPGVPVGTVWKNRKGVLEDRVHNQSQAGISYGQDGAYAVILSGGYEDDEDNGETFIYTGAGEDRDQDFDRGNRALKVSSETGKPVRVIRGTAADSIWSPEHGYRYDGLYIVERAWLAKGKSGRKICRFSFKRLEGQQPLVKYNYRHVLAQYGINKRKAKKTTTKKTAKTTTRSTTKSKAK